MTGWLSVAVLLLGEASLVSALGVAPTKHSGHRRNVKAAHPVAQPSPELTDALERPQMLFESMGSQMTELQSSLMAAKIDSQSAVTKMREEYEQKLKQQQERNNATAGLNQDLAARINSLTEHSEHLREHADELETRSRDVKMELEELRDNITLAQEYLDRVLNDSQVSLHEASELNILAELDQEDINTSQSRLHADRLEQIALAGKVAMIQVGAGEQKVKAKAEDPATQKLLQTLLTSLDGISNEQNTSDASLRVSFEEEYRAGDEQYAALIQNQTQLNATAAELEALNQNLSAAVAYLEKTYDHLLKERASLRQFARRLSSRPIPAVQLQAKRRRNVAYPTHINSTMATALEKPKLVQVVMPREQSEEVQSQRSANKEWKESAPVTPKVATSWFSWVAR